jgi:hypothetical protein
MSKLQQIGWSEFSLAERATAISASLKGKSVTTFTSPSDAGGNRRSSLNNPYVEHRHFFDDVLAGNRKQATVVNFGMILRHQLNIEFSNRKAFSSPSKSSIIADCGQYFYREVFTKLFSPIERGYKIDEKISRVSTYSFFTYTKWLYSFINQKYLKKEREQLFAILREALGSIHDFFVQALNVSTTSEYYSGKVDSPSGSHSGESGVLVALTESPNDGRKRSEQWNHHEAAKDAYKN